MSPGVEVVVLGGSAGALDGLETLLPALPGGLPAGLLVVVHLPPDRPSALAALFAGRIPLSAEEAEDGAPIEPGKVLFAPPDYHLLAVAGGRVALSIDAPVHFSRPSVDVLFESAADAYGPRLAAVVLSGANTDGAAGAARVAAAGGRVAVQDPATASARSMPEAALRAVPGAEVLAPAALAAWIQAIARGDA